MARANRDDNFIPAMFGVSEIDGETAVVPYVQTSTKRLYVTATGTVTVQQDKVSTATNTKVAIGNTSTSVLASNTNRVEATLVNDSNEDIYINLSGTAVINEGIRLNANGGTHTEDVYTGAITAICASGSKNLTVVER